MKTTDDEVKKTKGDEGLNRWQETRQMVKIRKRNETRKIKVMKTRNKTDVDGSLKTQMKKT